MRSRKLPKRKTDHTHSCYKTNLATAVSVQLKTLLGSIRYNHRKLAPFSRFPRPAATIRVDTIITIPYFPKGRLHTTAATARAVASSGADSPACAAAAADAAAEDAAAEDADAAAAPLLSNL